MIERQYSTNILPLPLPDERPDRVVLVMLRRMGGHGLQDSGAAMLALNEFGLEFRRPLVLLRAFMAELAEASTRHIQIAPCCAMRMTGDEGRLLEALAMAQGNSQRATSNLKSLTANDAVGCALSTAFAFNSAMKDLGYPLSG